jgi:hypothetical protein
MGRFVAVMNLCQTAQNNYKIISDTRNLEVSGCWNFESEVINLAFGHTCQKSSYI